MPKMRIDAVSAVDVDTLTLEQLRWRYGIGMDIVTGEGRNKTHRYRNGVDTPIGDIEEGVWYELVRKIVAREHDEPLMGYLREWYTIHKLYDTPEHLALQAYADRLPEHETWVDYIPFLQKYLPEKLEGKHLFRVRMVCCRVENLATQPCYLDNAVPCPKCGLNSPVTLIEEVVYHHEQT